MPRLRSAAIAHLHRLVVSIFIALLLNSTTIADDSTQVELGRLKQTIATLEKTLAASSEEQSGIEAELVQVEIEASEITANIRLILQKIGSAETIIAEKEKNKISIERRITQQNSAIAEQIRAAHRLGDQEPIKLLLNQEDPKAISRMFKYYDYFLEARGEKIEEYLGDVKALTKVIEEINKNKLELVVSKESLSLQQKNLSVKVAKRTLSLDKMQLTMSDDKKRLRGLQKQRGQLEQLLNAVQEA
ncbi:MAG: hypothetical protein HOI09_11770, partial [Porticoccaceae bacterium]|nr:hypothetical protein [Porticoccaceae bacterium]